MSDDRRERIGRAAWDAVHTNMDPWEDADPRARVDYKIIALAAVAEARKIDTCETCRWSGAERNPGGEWYGVCHNPHPGLTYNAVGCSRHEPKEG